MENQLFDELNAIVDQYQDSRPGRDRLETLASDAIRLRDRWEVTLDYGRRTSSDLNEEPWCGCVEIDPAWKSLCGCLVTVTLEGTDCDDCRRGHHAFGVPVPIADRSAAVYRGPGLLMPRNGGTEITEP